LLNADSPENNHKNIRRDLLKFIQYLNKTYCEPPMTYDEVIKSYNANWRKYKEGKIDFTNFYTKQRAFWSKQSTLTANEKRSVTCKIKNAPIIEDTKRKIWEAIEILNEKSQKITQAQVALVSGIALSTVKKYRHVYHEYKNMLSGETDILEIEGKIISISEEPNVNSSTEELAISNDSNLNIEHDCFELLDINVTDFEEERTTHISASEEIDSAPDYTEKQLQILYHRIFCSLQNQSDENTKMQLFEQFLNCFHQLPPNDAKLLIKSPENITDSDEFWKQFTLERKMWNLCTEIIQQ